MRCALVPLAAIAALPALAPASTAAAPAKAPARRVWSPPSAPLPSLPVITAVRLDVASDHVVVTEDVRLARGEAPAGDLRLFVAFGAPGAPRAFDARLLAGDADALEPLASATAEPLIVEPASTKPRGALALLGPSHMSGAVVAVRGATFQRATFAAGAAVIRLRTLLDAPPADPSGAREIVVRLGTEGGTPLALGRVEVHAVAPAPSASPFALAGAEAHLCGPDADPYPLSVALHPRSAAAATSPRPASPLLVSRRATDDLCVRVLEARAAPQN
jgi:hypothetical protein